MNYYDENYSTDKLIQLEVDMGTHIERPAPMTQREVAEYCATHDVCATAYVDGAWVGSTEI